MMSLIDLDDDQRWVPTHVNVTVLRARGLRTKGKHGSRYLYTVVQSGKDKYTTGLVEKAEVPEWNEECCFELLPGILEEGGRAAYPPGSGNLLLTVMHRVLIGLDVFLGQTVIPLDRIFQEGMCPRDEWFKLHSKAGRKEKERGELQLTVQFTRNNMTASMFDLTIKDAPRSAFGKLKDRVTGRKRGDVESSSAILPGRYAALSGSVNEPCGDEGVPVEMVEEKRSKVKEFFKGRLRLASDSRSCSSLASDSSMSSIASESLGPPPSLLTDPPSSPIYTSKVRVDSSYGEADLAKKVLTSQHTTKVMTHKRAFSDEVSKITTGTPRSSLPVESVRSQSMTQSKSSLCINGSHVYESEPSTPKSSAAIPSKLLLDKCSPLSRSLQNLTKRSEDKGSGEGRRWSFDKTKKEEKQEERDASQTSVEIEGHQAATPILTSGADSSEKGRKLKKTLFSGGRSDSLPAKTEGSQPAEGRLRGWFGSGDIQNKPRLEGSTQVDSSSDVPPPIVPCSPEPLQCPSPSPSPCHHDSITPTSSPSSTPISPSNPFLSRIQRNPFFEELISEELQRSPPLAPFSPSASSTFSHNVPPSLQHSNTPHSTHDVGASNVGCIKRERPRPVPRQVSLPTLVQTASTDSPSKRESNCKQEDGFDAFASSRLYSPTGNAPQIKPRTSKRSSSLRLNKDWAPELEEQPPPVPPRRLLRSSVSEIYSDGWLHRGQELAVHKEAYLLSQTGVASRQREREAEPKSKVVAMDSYIRNKDTVSGNSHTHRGFVGSVAEDKLRKFRYEPLEDVSDCWGGMFFEQDLYGRVFRANCPQPKATNRLSLNAVETTVNKITCNNLTPNMILDSRTSVMGHLKRSPCDKSDLDALQSVFTLEEQKDTPLSNLSKCLNNNMIPAKEDLNMNHPDFGFIDSDRSFQSESVDSLKGISSLEESVALDVSPVAPHNTTVTQKCVYTLKDTHIADIAPSDEAMDSYDKLCSVSSGHQDTCGDSGSNHPATEPREEKTNGAHLKRTMVDCDDNGNPQDELDTNNQSELFQGVVSARLRPKGISRTNSPNSQGGGGDSDFEQFLFLVQKISVSEDSTFYQPTETAVLAETCKTGSQISFKDLHAKVAPDMRVPSESKIGQSLQEPPHPILSAEALISPVCCPPVRTSSMGLPSAEARYTTCSTTDQHLVDAQPSLLPEKTQPSSNLPHQESRTHPVKPLTSSQMEKKESRSVLEKLKSTINPGRTAQQAAAETEASQEATVDTSAHYQHLTNMELISLLLQQEMDMQKQQVASEQQGAKLEKCEAELKKVKAQVRDLEDYIDNLLLRIMEQTPTLLQVRNRHK
ncbi:uncharacterized protein rab11fip5b [Synchiropus picturatus]